MPEWLRSLFEFIFDLNYTIENEAGDGIILLVL